MDINAFWTIIETARARSRPGKPFHLALADCLAAGSVHDIMQHQERFDEVHAGLYRWDLWASAYLIGGGCSDDGFIDFRAGLIAQGRSWHDRAAACPDSLAAHPAVAGARHPSQQSVLFYEEASYAARRAFGQVTGDEDGFNDAFARYPPAVPRHPRHPAGEHFDFDDLQQLRGRLPRLAAVCLPSGSA